MTNLDIALAASSPRPASSDIRLSELLSALSHALDITEGQPEGHCVRCCWIGTSVGREVGLTEPELWELYYTLLLKDVGCSSNSARISQLYLTDDIAFKHDAKTVAGSLPQVLRFVLSHAGKGAAAGLPYRLRALMNVFEAGGEFATEIVASRCERGADIARQLRFSDRVAAGIRYLDEHWDGSGQPGGRQGSAIPVYSQIALLAQVVDVFHTTAGSEATKGELRRRAGTWFDPALVAKFEAAAARPGFWEMLASSELESAILALEPARRVRTLDENFLDDIASAFAQIVDSKSPYTSGHSTRVAELTEMIAWEMHFTPAQRRWLKRGALLHDIGKLGVSNMILDKPGKLTAEEWVAMRNHAALTETILSRISAFDELARVAGAHHERLDGKGYPHGLRGDQIAMETRVLTTADIFDALTAKRPYRDAMPLPKALAVMAGDIGTAIDPTCFAALKVGLAKRDAA